MFKMRAVACGKGYTQFNIRKKQHIDDVLLVVQFQRPPSDIIMGTSVNGNWNIQEHFPNPISLNQTFEAVLVTMKTGFLLVIDGQLITKNYSYHMPLNVDYSLFVTEGYPVLEIDFKNGINWP